MNVLDLGLRATSIQRDSERLSGTAQLQVAADRSLPAFNLNINYNNTRTPPPFHTALTCATDDHDVGRPWLLVRTNYCTIRLGDCTNRHTRKTAARF